MDVIVYIEVIRRYNILDVIVYEDVIIYMLFYYF